MDATLQAACDAFLADLLAQLRDRQTAYAAARVPAGTDSDGRPATRARSRFWQGLPTPVVTPTKTVKRAPDLTRRAAGHADSWAGYGITMPATVPCAVEVHEYGSGTDHAGYIVLATVTVSGVVWRRVINVGPETWRARAWGTGG